MRSFLTLFIVFFTTESLAQDFARRIPRVRVGTVKKVQGSLVGLGRADRSLIYLTRGDYLYDRQTIITRKNSQAVLKLGLRSEITIGENSKIQLYYSQGKSQYLLRVFKGVIRGQYFGGGSPEVFITGNNLDKTYSAYEFDALTKGDRFYFKPRNKSRVYSYAFHNQDSANNLTISQKEIELLSQNDPNQKPVYFIKKSSSRKKGKKQKEEKSSTMSTSSAVAEAAAIFGDSVVEQTAPVVEDASELFSSDIDNTAVAADIFGEESFKKEPTIKLSDNTGLLREKENNELSFESLEKANRKLQKEEKKNPLDLSLFLKSTVYSSTPRQDVGNVDPQSFHQDLRLNFGNKYQFNDVESMTFTGWLDISNRKGVYNDLGETFDLQSSQRNYLYLNELYYTYTTQNYDIQFGKKILKTGKGIIYSPSDSFSPADATIPTSPLFLGNFFISLDYYLDDWTLTGILLPAVVPNKSPTQNSRWTTLYSDINFELRQDLPSGFSTRSTPIMLKLEGTKWGTDWLFTFFNGPNTNPVVRNDIAVINNVPTFTLVQEHIPITFFSAGFSTTFSGLELHGEILNQNAEEGKDDSFTALMIGTRYVMDGWPKALGLNSVDFILEHGRENLRSAQSQPFYALSSINARFYQNSWVGTMVFNVNDNLSFNYDFHFDLRYNGSAQIFGINYTTGTSQYRLKSELYSGDLESNFGQWDNNDNVSLEYLVNF